MYFPLTQIQMHQRKVVLSAQQFVGVLELIEYKMGPPNGYLVSGNIGVVFSSASTRSEPANPLSFPQLTSLTSGQNWHIFKPNNVDLEDPKYTFWIMIEQLRRFWPVAPSYMEIANEKQLGVVITAMNYIKINRHLRTPFYRAEDDELAPEDRDFILKMKKLDPRDGPMARELLQDDWFSAIKTS